MILKFYIRVSRDIGHPLSFIKWSRNIIGEFQQSNAIQVCNLIITSCRAQKFDNNRVCKAYIGYLYDEFEMNCKIRNNLQIII